jgi:Sulfotransferase domain
MRQNRLFTRFWHAHAARRARHLASPRLWYRRVTASRRRLPEFVIAGAQKAGTTSLFGYLSGHPRCAASWTKEVHYFDQHFARGENWYRMHFPLDTPPSDSYGGQATTRCFESSPYYMFDPRVPARMAETLPGAKVIFLLRNPASRAYSHYQHSVRRGREPLSFEAALDAEPQRLAGEHQRLLAEPRYQSDAHRHFSYLARGAYADQLLRWQTLFPPQQLLVIEAERMFKAPREVFGQVLQFLGLEAWMPADFKTRNSGRYTTPMSAAARDRLTRYFAPHNERLFELIGARYDWR